MIHDLLMVLVWTRFCYVLQPEIVIITMLTFNKEPSSMLLNGFIRTPKECLILFLLKGLMILKHFYVVNVCFVRNVFMSKKGNSQANRKT
jgi:hypothetical protein